MKGEVHQLICLAAAANGTLAGMLDPASFYPGHQSFGHCNKVSFVDIGRQPSGDHEEIERCASPLDWLEELGRAGVRSVWLDFVPSDQPDVPDHVLAAFAGGGGDPQLVVSGPLATERWTVRWRVSEDPPSEGQPWAVTYGCFNKEQVPTETPRVDIDATAARLLSVLQDISDFAETHAPGWEDVFQGAFETLQSGPAAMGGIRIPCFTAYPPMARRLYAAAYKAWVFGGMGSWNDMGFEDPRLQNDYQSLSANLYTAIMHTIHVASCTFGQAAAKS